jgi:hypothetical protein
MGSMCRRTVSDFLIVLVPSCFTPKAFANSQPRVALWQPWEHAIFFPEGATLKELRLQQAGRKPVAIPSELRQEQIVLIPRVSKQTLG